MSYSGESSRPESFRILIAREARSFGLVRTGTGGGVGAGGGGGTGGAAGAGLGLVCVRTWKAVPQPRQRNFFPAASSGNFSALPHFGHEAFVAMFHSLRLVIPRASYGRSERCGAEVWSRRCVFKMPLKVQPTEQPDTDGKSMPGSSERRRKPGVGFSVVFGSTRLAPGRLPDAAGSHIQSSRLPVLACPLGVLAALGWLGRTFRRAGSVVWTRGYVTRSP